MFENKNEKNVNEEIKDEYSIGHTDNFIKVIIDEKLEPNKFYKITKRIKELQNDRRFMFKLTDDIIALVYRIAVEDCSKEKKDPDKAYKKDELYTFYGKIERSKKGLQMLKLLQELIF